MPLFFFGIGQDVALEQKIKFVAAVAQKLTHEQTHRDITYLHIGDIVVIIRRQLAHALK